eukprot:TRINITY_DN3260_c0_g2_i1.p1 TRINITY_DN3260_c0_g2~~TRINITY_DN3260_c0_g2_i1.p1  ORF type:complete len:628 (+),score=122.93 TRINITY_DN3260_c0_g2_i1:69-1952(+)
MLNENEINENEREEVEPVPIKWENVTIKVKERTLLTKVYGFCPPGKSLAILGESGSGKTTLLNFLCGRCQYKEVSGNYYLGGYRITNQKELKGCVTTITQEEVIYPTETVFESLKYHFILRNEGTIEERKEKADSMLDQLELNRIRNGIIGKPTSTFRISGGERKRVNIGTEMGREYSQILFADEPTSGLDSATAFKILSLLVDIQRTKNIPFICVIHQPQRSLFDLFDRYLILKESNVMYYGEKKDLHENLERNNLKCPDYVNLADYVLDIFNENSDNKMTDEQKDALARVSKENFANETLNHQEFEIKKHAEFNSSRTTQFGQLAKRQYHAYFRSKEKISARIFSIVFDIFLALAFLQLGYAQEDIQSRAGAIFFLLLSLSFGAAFTAIFSFFNEKEIFRRERFNWIHTVSVFVFSRYIIEFFMEIWWIGVEIHINYFLIGLKPGYTHLLLFWLIAFLLALCSFSIAFCIGAFSKTINQANVILPIIIETLNIFAGFYVQIDQAVPWLRWLSQISFSRYAYQIVLYDQFNGISFTCTSEQVLPNGLCPIPDGNTFLKRIGFDSICIGCNIIWLLVFFIVVNILFYVGVFFLVNLVHFGTKIKIPQNDDETSISNNVENVENALNQ